MKILYFYPENPLLLNQGNNARANALLNYFKNRNFDVDFVAEDYVGFNKETIASLKQQKLANNVFLLKKKIRKENKLSYFFTYSLPNALSKKIKQFDRLRFGYQENFNSILAANNYDYIIISYVYWAPLIKNNKNTNNALLCIDTHDFLTAQFQTNEGFELGKYFEKEIEIINLFDKIFVISSDEKYLFSQFSKKEIITITHSVAENTNIHLKKYDFDLIYVASDNDHNINSANWFFKEVYPKLNKNLKIIVIGQISQYCPEIDNVYKVNFIENLDDIYKKSKIAICPMLSGTGLKIKVIEAMSFGIPIVCNERGLDGLINKSKNGCLSTNDPQEFADFIDELVNNSVFYSEQSNLAQLFFKENHSLEKNYEILDKVFQ